jgi:hypothetical protein
MKKGIFLSFTSLVGILGAAIFSCGGGSGSSSSSSSTTPKVVGSVSSSVVVNATVCLEDANNNTIVCNQTDANGTFVLNLNSNVSLNETYISLQVKGKDGSPYILGTTSYVYAENITKQLDPNATVININPLNLASGNITLANSLGALIHALGNDTTGNATSIDISQVKIDSVVLTDGDGHEQVINNNNLANALKEALKENYKLNVNASYGNSTVLIMVEPNNSTAEVHCNNKTYVVKYNCTEKEKEWKEHILETEKLYEHMEQEAEHMVNATENETQHVENETEQEAEHMVNATENETQHVENETENKIW